MYPTFVLYKSMVKLDPNVFVNALVQIYLKKISPLNTIKSYLASIQNDYGWDNNLKTGI